MSERANNLPTPPPTRLDTLLSKVLSSTSYLLGGPGLSIDVLQGPQSPSSSIEGRLYVVFTNKVGLLTEYLKEQGLQRKIPSFFRYQFLAQDHCIVVGDPDDMGISSIPREHYQCLSHDCLAFYPTLGSGEPQLIRPEVSWSDPVLPIPCPQQIMGFCEPYVRAYLRAGAKIGWATYTHLWRMRCMKAHQPQDANDVTAMDKWIHSLLEEPNPFLV